MKSVSLKVFWQTFIGSTVLLSAFAFYQTAQQISALGIILWQSKWIAVLGIFILNVVAGILVLRQLALESDSRWIENVESSPRDLSARLFGLLLVLLGFSITWGVRLTFFGNILPQVTPIFWVFLWATLLQSFGLKLITGLKLHILFAFTVLVQGVIFQTYGHLTVISDYPFSIGYSEAGRHYYASLFFAKSLYAMQVPLPFLHPTRYYLMSLPFLLKGLPLWFHRTWQAMLWIGLTASSSILLARRLSLQGWMKFLVAAWVFLYFFQGAVYYHLHVCISLILAGVSTRYPWRSFLFVILASAWAGVSRVNWFPVPAMLAIAIYILETAFRGKGWRYWLTPFLWGVSGVLAAIISQFVYIKFSGNADIRTFGSSFTSELLWNRLLPNQTFPLGILLGITLVSGPLIMAIVQMVRGKFSLVHPLRWVGLLAMLLVLFSGGLVVSVKIGGGADLHNQDAFLVLLALIATSFFASRVAGEDGPNPLWGQIHWPVIVAALLVPIGFALSHLGLFPSYDHFIVEKDIQKLQGALSGVAANGEEVLFVTERQLLTFKILRDIPLVPEYEQSELMEMAMSGNREYLEHFYSDLKGHRFAFIIAEEQKYSPKKGGAFIEEDTAWVRYVGAPILCAYKPVEFLSSANVQIFIPRPSQPACKDPFLE